MRFATITSDLFQFAEPKTGPARLRALLVDSRIRAEIEEGPAPGTYSLSYGDEAGGELNLRMNALATAMGPLLQEAVEIRLAWDREDVSDGAGPLLFYAGPTPASIEACKVRCALERASEQLEHVFTREERMAILSMLQPANPAASPEELRLRRLQALQFAAVMVRQAGEPELAKVLQRGADEARLASEPPAAEVPLWRHTVLVTVLSESADTLESCSLAEIHHEITTGNSTGQWGVLSIEPLDRDSARQAVTEVGSDPSFFGLDEDDDESQDNCGSSFVPAAGG